MKTRTGHTIPEYEYFRRVSLSLDSLDSSEIVRFLDEHEEEFTKSPLCVQLVKSGWSRGAALIQACQKVLERMMSSVASHREETDACMKCLMTDHYQFRTFEGETIKGSYHRLRDRYRIHFIGKHAFNQEFVYRRLEPRTFFWGMRIFYGAEPG